MEIPDGYTDLRPGKIASIVTYLEMSAPAAGKRGPTNPAWVLRSYPKPDVDWYRKLFRLVGQEWLWFSRLQMTDEVLRQTIHDPRVDIFSLEVDGKEKGILELDRREMPEIELAFIGLTTDLLGQGVGRFLIEEALERAWAHKPTRVLVHTCTLDHHRALPFYIKAGFVPYKRAIEVSDDPRLDGTLSADAAAHCPII